MEEKSLPQIVGKNLATLRKAKGLTQQQFAEQVHYSDKSVSKWELGYTIPSVDILMDIASFYGVTGQCTSVTLTSAVKLNNAPI